MEEVAAKLSLVTNSLVEVKDFPVPMDINDCFFASGDTPARKSFFKYISGLLQAEAKKQSFISIGTGKSLTSTRLFVTRLSLAATSSIGRYTW